MPHLVHILPGFGTGGIQSVLCRVLNGLGSDWRHSICSLGDDLSAGERLAANVRAEVSRVPAEIASLGTRVRFLRELAPDLVLTSNWGSMDWLIANVVSRVAPHVHQEHGFGPEEATGQLRRRVWTRRLALRGVRKLIVPSRTLESIARDSWWVPPGRFERIENGVDREQLVAAARAAHDISLPEGRVVIATVAPLRPEKRIDRLIRAFADMACRDRAALLIIGDGAERAGLEGMASELGVASSVIFAGYRAEPARSLAHADIYAITSDTEQLPASVIEAMALGLPVVGTDVGDVRSMLAEPNRQMVVPREDGVALAGAMAALVEDDGLRRALGDRNRKVQERVFDASTMVERYGRLLEEVLGGK